MLVLHGEAGGKEAVTATVLACSKHGKLLGKRLHSGNNIKLISHSLAHTHRRPVSAHLNSTDWDCMCHGHIVGLIDMCPGLWCVHPMAFLTSEEQALGLSDGLHMGSDGGSLVWREEGKHW